MTDSARQEPPAGEGPSGRPLPLSVRLLGAGVRSARNVTKATGIDSRGEAAAEEAMVAAIESEAVERALARVLKGPVVEETVQSALDSETVKSALIEALDSELVDEVWRRLLASDEAQRLVERIAEAPEIRAAISAQSVGLVEDIGHTIGNGSRRLDAAFERLVRRVFRRRQREEPTDRAGAVTRGLALGLDALIVNLSFAGLSAIAALVVSVFSGTNDGGASDLALALGGSLWLGLGALYLVGFWSLAGQTPGMRFIGTRLDVEGRGLPPGRSLKRLLGLWLSVVTFGIGFLGTVFDQRRRDWADRLGGADIRYVERTPTPAPWSTLTAEAGAGEAGTTKAPGARGLRPQQVA